MPQVIENISDDDIRYAEKILLPNGKEFDEERKVFIRNFNTIDLQAVPGSGKTTALLAKLVVLERKLPFNDGSGILVLSHTNAAIDEIKKKIQKHCPKLFSYPNFIGTIQSFVDEFLAIPYYVHKCKKKPNRIDHEIYNEVATKHYNNLPNSAAKSWLNNQHDPENLFKNFRFDIDLNLTNGMNGNIVLRSNSNSTSYKTFKTIKQQILLSGVLNYDDAYFLAECYLKELPNIRTILQKRFSFVFVDEMQDIDTHQYNLLEKIFYDDGNSISKIQRIGDKNQAIYNSVKATDVWQDRADILRLNGSQRLSKPIADVVKKFALYSDANFDIVGKNECEIKPHILVFETANIGNIIPSFVQIIKDNGLTNSDKPIKVVCWNTDWKDDEASRNDATKLRLEDYHKGFKKEKGKPKQDYDNLKSYLLYYEKKQTLEPLRKNILNAFLKILRLENINMTDHRPYTKKKLIDFIHDKDIQKYDELNLNLYNWSIGIIQEKTNEVWESIKAYVPTLLHFFDRTISTSSDFINTDNVEISADNPEIFEPTNHYKEDGLEIEITSVHAVKGQTHCATLYLESCYQGKHESERLSNQFLGNSFNDTKVHHKSSVKMAFVGFSRPTDLLCIAIHKERFDELLNTINSNIWEIKTVTANA
ncbi:MAG: UvrD-helicase domain-containing protein [Flavobacteriales bacterium]|nr:UvrD-helicase domain-containing protein [Flavobacteriales bacterium]